MDGPHEFEGCQILDKLRSGPVADLYHAIQQPLGRPVLIKALSSSILPSSPFAATLEREARLLAVLHHPNILHVYDYVRRDDRMWLVLEHVDGWPLDELLQKEITFSPGSAIAITLEVARALDHAHERGIVHRDIQPRNVFVSRTGRIKLLNFSVAVDERLPTAPELLDGGAGYDGPQYMSPEQILGEPADPRSDIFSLGVVMYELLSGVPPFAGEDEKSTTQRIRHDPPAPLTRRVPGISAALERCVLRCLEKLPSDRFFSAAELVQALEALLNDLGEVSSQRWIGELLERAELVDKAPASLHELPPPVTGTLHRPSLGPALYGMLVAFGLIVIGGGAVQYVAAKGADGSPPRENSQLELIPPKMAHLRVVADPWARVSVDGEHIDTTPFARAIPLRAGTHYVRLEHPNAPVERRTVRLVAGESVLLDVKMNVTAPPKARPSANPAVDGNLADADAGPDARPSP